MARTRLIETYSRFDTPDMPQRIAEYIDSYLEKEGIEELPWREIHGRHTGHLDISNGGFRMDHDFVYPVLTLCKLDRQDMVSADLNKINKSIDHWREILHNPPESESNDGEEMPDDYDDEHFEASDYDESDTLYEIKNALIKDEFDSYRDPESPMTEETACHGGYMDVIRSMKINPDIEYDKFMKDKIQLEKCRRIFYNWGKEALNDFLLSMEIYDSKHDSCHADPEHFDSSDIKRMREKFDVWDEDRRAQELEEMYQGWKAEVDEYWNDPEREHRSDWISPTYAEDMLRIYLEERNQPSFAEFVSNLRRGIYGELPEDYDGLAASGYPG